MAERLDPGTLPTTLLHHLADGRCRTMDELARDPDGLPLELYER